MFWLRSQFNSGKLMFDSLIIGEDRFSLLRLNVWRLINCEIFKLYAIRSGVRFAFRGASFALMMRLNFNASRIGYN